MDLKDHPMRPACSAFLRMLCDYARHAVALACCALLTPSCLGVKTSPLQPDNMYQTQKRDPLLQGNWFGCGNSSYTRNCASFSIDADGSFSGNLPSWNYNSGIKGRWFTTSDSLVVIGDTLVRGSSTLYIARYGFNNKCDSLFLFTDTSLFVLGAIVTSPVIQNRQALRQYPFVVMPGDTQLSILDSVQISWYPYSGSPKPFSYQLQVGARNEPLPYADSSYDMFWGIGDVGEHTISVSAVDDFGTVYPATVLQVNVQMGAPSVTFHDTVFFMSDRAVLRVSGSDLNGRIVKYVWTFVEDSTQVTTIGVDSLIWKFDDFGDYVVRVQAQDDDGILSASSSGIVTIAPTTIGTNLYESGIALDQFKNGDFACIGTRSSAGLIFRTNNHGRLLWERQYDGAQTNFTDVLAGDDGKTIVIGSGEGSKFLFIVLDQNGDELVARDLNTSEYARSGNMTKLPNGDYLISGYSWTSTDITYATVVRVSPNGNVVWRKNYRRGTQTYGNALSLTQDNHALLVGTKYVSVYGGAASVCFAMKINLDGDSIWSTELNTSSSGYTPSAVTPVGDSTLLIAGLAGGGPFSGWRLVNTSKVSLRGEIIYNAKSIGRQTSYVAPSLLVSSDGGVLVGASTEPDYSGRSTIHMFLTNSDIRDPELIFYCDGALQDMVQTSDGGYVGIGSLKGSGEQSDTDILLFKIDAYGKRIW